MSCLEIDPDKDVPEWSALTDNRDFKAVPSWDPIDRAVNDELISESFMLEQKFLKYRSLAMRALATAVYISEDIHPSRLAALNIAKKDNITSSNSTGNDTIAENISDAERGSLLGPVLERLIDSLVDHHQEVKRDSVNFHGSNNLAFGPDTPRLTLYVNSFHIDLLVELLRLTLNIYKLATKKQPLELDKSKEQLETLSKNATSRFKDIVGNLEEFLNTHKHLLYKRNDKLESIINATESASFAAILCGVCHVLLKSGNKFVIQDNQNNTNSNSIQGKQLSNKKEKKKGGKNVLPSAADSRKDLNEYYPIFNEMIENITSSISSLLSLVEDFEKVVAQDQVNVLQCQFSSFKLENDHENGKIQKSSEQTLIDTNSQNDTKKEVMDTNIKTDLKSWETLGSIQSDIHKQMESSYEVSFLQIKTVIQNKQNYFNCLKCDIGLASQVKK